MLWTAEGLLSAPLLTKWAPRGPISRPTRACAREAETIAPAHSSRTAATGPDYGSAGRPPHIFGVPDPPAPIIAPVSRMSEKTKRNLVKPRSRPFRSGWSPPSAGLSGSRGFSRAAIRACRCLRPEVGREGDHGVRLSATRGLGLEEFKFAYDSLLEGDGFEPSVPGTHRPG